MADAPCEPWPLDLDCLGLPDGDYDDLIERAQSVASTILWRLSGRRWGTCVRTVRPCRRSCLTGVPSLAWSGRLVPYTIGGRWYNASVCGCTGECGCTELCEVVLQGPVASIVEVLVDGAVVDPASYRLDSGGRLVREGDGCWPACQDLSAPPDGLGAFAVVYERGIPVDDSATAAVTELTAELVRSCIPDCDCRLPRTVTSRTMQGVSEDFGDLLEAVADGRTGLYLVDLWLSSVNPWRLPQAPRVLSPDRRGYRTEVWRQ